MGRFKPGDPKPVNSGRRPGSVNKKSLLVKDILESHGINLIEQILVRLPELPREVQVDTLLKLAPYCYPKLAQIEVSGNIDVKDRLLAEVSNEDLDAILTEAKKV
jgi:hypothetical protein